MSFILSALMYQIKVLTLICIKAHVENVCNYDKYQEAELSTENEAEYGKFHDASFKYIMNGKMYFRLFQIKHVDNEDEKITYKDLEDSNRYSLTKYFKSFLNTNKNEVECYIFYTNPSFDADDAKLNGLFHEITAFDDILDVNMRFGDKVPKKLKFIYSALKRTELYNVFIKLARKHKDYITADKAELLVKEFCDKFTFATGQHNCNEMSLELEHEIRKIYGNEINIDNVEKLFFDWMQYRNHVTLTYKKFGNIINIIKQESNSSETTKYNLKYKRNYFEDMDDLL